MVSIFLWLMIVAIYLFLIYLLYDSHQTAKILENSNRYLSDEVARLHDDNVRLLQIKANTTSNFPQK